MIQEKHSAPQADRCHLPSFFQWKALRLLSEAGLAAQAERQDVWQFAVEIGQLRVLGLSHTDLRRLLCWGYLEHAQERTTAGARQRTFQQLRTLVFPRRTCFILTTKGQEMLSSLAARDGLGGSESRQEAAALPCSSAAFPRWDSSSRQLCWQNNVIKEFRRPATNQELVLSALQEEGWPPQIDDPLPQSGGIDPKIRLHDTIKRLNGHHHYRILRFGGDGTGQRIHWFFLAQT